MKLLLIAIFIAAVYSANTHLAQLKFDAFVNQYGKNYVNEAEKLYRFEIFAQNLDKIDALNAKSRGAVFGVTKFTDLTKEEFKEMYLMNPITPREEIDEELVVQPLKNVALPTTFDWRKQGDGAVTPVKDQGQCGSCWAFSITENIESMWILAGKANASSLRLAPQQVVDCDQVDAGCNGGNPESAYQYVMQAGGLESEASYPYTAQDGTCQFQSNKVVARISNWKYATSSRNEKTLQQNLVSWGPLSICVDAEYWQYYTSGVMTAWECAWINTLDHCVQLVGYDQSSSTPYWMVRNSWGTDWGINGYIHLQMFANTCGLTNEATTSVI